MAGQALRAAPSLSRVDNRPIARRATVQPGSCRRERAAHIARAPGIVPRHSPRAGRTAVRQAPPPTQPTEIIQHTANTDARLYRAGTLSSFSSRAAAAAVSASCFELPSATASASAPIEAFTVKRGAWCGPERSITS